MGLLVSGSFSVSYVYLLEFFTPEWQPTIGTFDSIIHCIAWGLTPFYFIYVSKNYVWLIGVGVLMNLIAVFGFIFFLDESPIYLYSKGEV